MQSNNLIVDWFKSNKTTLMNGFYGCVTTLLGIYLSKNYNTAEQNPHPKNTCECM